MKKVGIYEAKTHFSRLIAEVKLGGQILIHDRGKPVARLVSVGEDDEAATDLVQAFRELRAGARPVSRREARAWVNEGRK